MASHSSSSTSSSDAAAAGPLATLRWAAAALLALNLFVGLRLEPLLRESHVGDLLELDARLASFPRPERVQVLVLGNSHAQHMLRPPSLGPALGLAADEVFNLALPGATAFETGLIARRYLPRFPAARRAILGVDEVLLMLEPGLYDDRIRYQTRQDPVARWRYAGSLPDVEQRLALFAWLPFPLADFAPAFREALRERPGLLASRLVRGDGAWAPGTSQAETAASDYRWGYPPTADLAHDTQAGRARFARFRQYRWLLYRAAIFHGAPTAAERSLADLEATCRALEARGLAVELVAPVYTRALTRHLARARGPEQRAYRVALAAYLRASGRRLRASNMATPDAAFVDADHLSSSGARMYAEDLAPRLRWAP